ncbi:MAG: hypothetical protein KIG51_01845 [Fibrobacter sp.]|nr:hypothetical protein [Fibrobacter sp.]
MLCRDCNRRKSDK